MGGVTKLIVRCSEENKALIGDIQSALAMNCQEAEIKFVTPVETDSYQTIYRKRIKALAEGAKFLLEATTENKEAIGKVEELRSIYLARVAEINNEKGNMAHYQNALYAFKTELVRLFKDNNLLEDNNLLKKDIEHYLGRAEEYVLLRQPRPTLITIAEGGLVQIEQPQNAFSEKTKTEFLAATEDEEANWPEWFKTMDDTEQQMFRHAMKDVGEKNFAEKINAISSKLRSIPGVPNFSLHILASIKKDGSIEIQRQSLRSSHIATRDIEVEDIRHDFVKGNLRQIFDAGFELLNLKLKKVIIIPKDVNAASLVTDVEGAITDVKSAVTGVTSAENIVFEKLPVLPILAQTLITPILEPDGSLNKDKEVAIRELAKEYQNKIVEIDGQRYRLQIISTNHPLNYVRFAFSSDTEKEAFKLIKMAKEFLAKDSEGNKVLKAFTKNESVLNDAVDELNKAINKGSRFNDKREIYMAGLENFIVEKMWKAAGCSMAVKYRSCVSGKDRQGLSEIYSDALQLFFEETGKILKYNDTSANEKRFAEIYAELFCTRHQHFNANQNALGANGLKTPAMYLPKEIQTAIKKFSKREDLFHESDVLATNNEIDKIKRDKSEPLVFAERQVSRGLSAVAKPTEKTLIDKEKLAEELERIFKAIGEKRVYRKSLKSLVGGHREVTKGIVKIREILDVDMELDQLKQMEQLLEKRAHSSKWMRTKGTTEFYKQAYEIVKAMREEIEQKQEEKVEVTKSENPSLPVSSVELESTLVPTIKV